MIEYKRAKYKCPKCGSFHVEIMERVIFMETTNSYGKVVHPSVELQRKFVNAFCLDCHHRGDNEKRWLK